MEVVYVLLVMSAVLCIVHSQTPLDTNAEIMIISLSVALIVVTTAFLILFISHYTFVRAQLQKTGLPQKLQTLPVPENMEYTPYDDVTNEMESHIYEEIEQVVAATGKNC
ncbi:uncharacterized protein LOC121871251 [Homarus americanus]|uniref:uncharacterized protein LOC121871251 n=1 Tax=Homarus americanus TaxID=6706 RepID=UPI001C46DCB1|nr:uncharacterized protein LOC121871251 [Homarus americanus]